MMKKIIFILTVLLVCSCEDERIFDQNNLADYVDLYQARELGNVVACAGGKESGLLSVSTEPTDVFFYPIEGAEFFRYFESNDISAPLDYSKYTSKSLDGDPVFNGYLRRFSNPSFEGERYGIVTYLTEETFHISNPIRLKTNDKPTEVNSSLIQVEADGTTPSFSWEDGLIDENSIYFHVVSDENNNLISGTYTTDKFFKFYDLSNVVFNITDTTSTPSLEPNKNYTFSLMGVSEDNWINLFGQVEFSTN